MGVYSVFVRLVS